MHPASHNLLLLPVLQMRVIFYNALLIDNLLVGLDCPEWSVLLLNKMVGLEYRIDLVNYIQLSDPDPCSLFKASIRPKWYTGWCKQAFSWWIWVTLHLNKPLTSQSRFCTIPQCLKVVMNHLRSFETCFRRKNWSSRFRAIVLFIYGGWCVWRLWMIVLWSLLHLTKNLLCGKKSSFWRVRTVPRMVEQMLKS